ncbi:tyrosine-type recombinase/integrase [Actinoplanes sp. NPDC000266]
MASIYARGKSFCVRWRAACGRQQCCTFSGPSNIKALAAKQYVEAQGALVTRAQVYAAIDPSSSRALPRPPTTPLRQWIERWLALKVDIAPTTHAEYARILRGRVAAEFGDLQVAEISRYEHLDPWKAALSRELMPAGVRKHWTVLNQVMRDAVPHLRSDNPMRRPVGRRGNGLPRVTPHHACVLDADQVDILLEHCPAAIRDLVVVVLGTGLRLGEVLGLRIADVGLGSDPVARVERTLRRDGTFAEPKTARSRRTVALTPSTAAVFGRLIVGRRPEELVFTAPRGGPWNAGTLRRRYWQRAVVAAQRCPQHPPAAALSGWVSPRAVSACHCPGRLRVRPRLQDLRHTHVAYLVAAGWDFLAIQLRLGHASVRTTFDVYGHLLPHGDHSGLMGLDRQLRPIQSARTPLMSGHLHTRHSARPSGGLCPRRGFDLSADCAAVAGGLVVQLDSPHAAAPRSEGTRTVARCNARYEPTERRRTARRGLLETAMRSAEVAARPSQFAGRPVSFVESLSRAMTPCKVVTRRSRWPRVGNGRPGFRSHRDQLLCRCRIGAPAGSSSRHGSSHDR